MTGIVEWSHFVSIGMFAIGLFGFLTRKNALVVLMCLELMLNSVNLFLVEVSMRSGTGDGLILLIFSITIAAAEAAVGLGIMLNLHRLRGTIEMDMFRSLQG